MVWVTKAQYVHGHTLHLWFNDGRDGRVDLRETVYADSRDLFHQLRDQSQFQKFQVAMDTVVWENGLDLAPEFLYGMLEDAAIASHV